MFILHVTRTKRLKHVLLTFRCMFYNKFVLLLFLQLLLLTLLLLRKIMLVVPGSSPAGGENLSNRKRVFIAHSITSSPSNPRDMAEKLQLLNRKPSYHGNKIITLLGVDYLVIMRNLSRYNEILLFCSFENELNSL